MKGNENVEEEAAERIVCWRLGHLLEWRTAEQRFSPLPLLLAFLPLLFRLSAVFFTFCSQFDAADLAFVFTTLQGGQRNEEGELEKASCHVTEHFRWFFQHRFSQPEIAGIDSSAADPTVESPTTPTQPSIRVSFCSSSCCHFIYYLLCCFLFDYSY